MAECSKLILLIEDDSQTRRILKSCLVNHGWQVAESADGATGLADVDRLHPDLVILDLGLPDMDGVSLIKRLRPTIDIPILVLSARIQEQQKVEALNAGADDYLTKPFGVSELKARLQALLRRMNEIRQTRRTLRLGNLFVDLTLRRVVKDGQEIHLTPIEYRLFELLLKNAGAVLTHRQILHEVWGPEHVDDLHYLRIYMGQLRHKLESDPTRPKHLITDVGIGYRWID